MYYVTLQTQPKVVTRKITRVNKACLITGHYSIQLLVCRVKFSCLFNRHVVISIEWHYSMLILQQVEDNSTLIPI